MTPNSITDGAFRGILFVLVCILSISVEIIIAKPRIHALRSMTSGLRQLTRKANITPTRFPTEGHSSNQFIPAQQSITQWRAFSSGGNHGQISKMNGAYDYNKTRRLIDESGSSITTTPSNRFSETSEDQHETQKLIGVDNVDVENRSTSSDVHLNGANNHQTNTRKLTEGGDDDIIDSTSKDSPRQSDSSKPIEVNHIAVTEENETQYNTINEDGGENTPLVKRIEDGGTVDINEIDYPIFRSHKTYVIQDHNPKMPTTYYWIGKESSDKDAGEAAGQAVRLDSQIQKRISVCREVEGKESPTFRALFKHYFKHDGNLLDDGFSNVREEKLKELASSELKNIPEEHRINGNKTRNLTLENAQGNLEQTEIREGHKRFDVEIFRIYGKHEWTLTNWSVKDERSIFHHMPIETLNSEDCYLTDTHSDVGLLVWMGEKAGTFVRAEAARKAELHLRRRKYDYATPITFLDQEDVPPQVETLEELVHIIEPLIMDDIFTSERIKNGDNRIKNGNDHDEHSSRIIL